MKKRLLSCILVLSMLLSVCSFAAIAEDDAQAEDASPKYALEIGFLTTIGLIDSEFDWEANVTKAEMAKYIAGAMHPEMDFSQALEGVAFNDVPATHEYYPYIKACKDLGIVKGDYDNNFNPDNQVSAIEAMTMMINALSYTPYAEAFGGYPTGYFQVATQTGIAKGVSISSSQAATGEVVAKIIYNSLFADIVQLNGISNGSVELVVNKGKNLLSERLGIYEYDATVVDNGVGALYGAASGNPEIAVIKDNSTNKNITAYVCDTDVNEYLGYRVKAFVRNNPDTGRNEFVYVAPHTSYKAVTLNAKYIFNVTADYVEYDEDINTSDYEKLSIGGVTPIILVNGARITDIPNQTAEPLLKQIMPNDGLVTLIDNTGDAIYDVVNILSFNYLAGSFKSDARNIYVESVEIDEDEGEYSISCAYNPTQSLDLSKDVAGFSFVGNEEIKTIDDVYEEMIVSVAECPELVDGKPYYYLAVCDDVVESVLSAKSNNTIILEDGTEYELSSSLKSNFINYLPMGKSATFYIDITGKIAYAESESGSSKNYAYMVLAVERPYAGRNTTLVKVFTNEGEMKELRLSDKCLIDGVRYNNSSGQVAALMGRPDVATIMEGAGVKGRPVIMDVNSDDLITRIDTDNPNVSLGYRTNSGTYVDAVPIVKSSLYAGQHVIPYSEEDEASFDTLKAGFRNPKASAISNKTIKSVEGKFFITNNTTVINTAEIDTYALGSDVYSQFSPSIDRGAHNYQVYPSNYSSIAQVISNEGEEEEYQIVKAANVATGILYDIQGYDIDPETGVAGLAVIRGRVITTTPTASTPLVVYSRRTEVYDADQEKSVAKLYFYNTSGKEESVLYDPELLTETYSNLVDGHLRQGDLVRYLKDKDGYISYIDRFESVDRLLDGTTLTTKAAIEITDGIADATKPAYLSYSNNTFSVGYINKINGSVAEAVVGGNGMEIKTLTKLVSELTPGAMIPANRRLFFDFGKNKPLVITFTGTDMRVESGKLDDIVTIKDATDINGNINYNSLSIVLVRQSRFTPNMIIVYNGLDHSQHLVETEE